MNACQRCGRQTRVTIMSMFNKQVICMDCKDAEMERPDYKAAAEAEAKACRQGDLNFPGIGMK